MSSIVLGETVRIPAGISGLESYRDWARSPEFPEFGSYSYLSGELWAYPSRERAAHNLLKGQFVAVLTLLVQQLRLGEFFGDGMLLTNVAAELSTIPDGMFVSFPSLRSGRVRLDDELQSLEVEGSPDMTLEVVSDTSVKKDTEVLRELYWQARVREYWLVDPLGDEVSFEILRHTPRGYATTRKQAGWQKSLVFGKSFRLVQSKNVLAMRKFQLEVR
jgi:Uma2 family endonuclease